VQQLHMSYMLAQAYRAHAVCCCWLHVLCLSPRDSSKWMSTSSSLSSSFFTSVSSLQDTKTNAWSS
jgi:hypothetical protein